MSPISRKSIALMGIVVVVVAAIAGGIYYYMTLPPTEEKTTISFWIHTYTPAQELLDQLIPAFETANPDIAVELVDISYKQFEPTLSVALAGGEGPDLWWLGDFSFRAFFEKGVIAPTDYEALGYETQEDFLERYWNGAMDGFIVDDVCYSGGITEYNTYAVLYNKECFDRAGVPIPSESASLTWEQFAELAKDLTLYNEDENMIQMGFGWNFLDHGRRGVSVLEPFLQQYGGDILDPETNAPVNRTAWINAARYIYDCGNFGAYGFDDPTFTITLNPANDVYNGRVAMGILGPWAYQKALSVNSSFVGGFMPLPHVEGRPKVTCLYSYSMFVNAMSSAEKQTSAWKFIKFLFNDENTFKWFDEVGYIQPTRAPGYREHAEQTIAYANVFWDGFEHASYSFRHTKYFEIAEEIPKFGHLLLIAGTDPETAVDMVWDWIKSSAS